MFAAAPALTLTEGHAALHQAIAGDRLRIALDRTLAEAVADAPVAHPALVWDAAIGQSTVATGRVVANLFYRGLLLRRVVRLGDTLRTTTEVVARRENRPKEGRRPTGLALLRIRTVDQEDRPVLDFTRCAMLPLRARRRASPATRSAAPPTSTTNRSRPRLPGSTSARTAPRCRPALEPSRTAGRSRSRAATSWTPRPALARLTTNVAMAHLDATSTADGRRLVYGGHAIGLAAAQAARALPALVTILGWHSCDHTAPVFEGATLRSRIELERREPLPGGGGLLHLRSRVSSEEGDVLDWRFVGVLA